LSLLWELYATVHDRLLDLYFWLEDWWDS